MTDLRVQLQTTLGDAYRVERELGGGGMSRVFVVTDQSLGRQIVVKLLAPELAAGVSAERFAREVKLAARLQQANIVPMLSAGETDGLPWYSMPFVRGESLRAKLVAGGETSLTEVVSILRDVARALAFAHGEGIVHRDIKPENILLSGGAAVVTDFGIAKAVTSSRTAEGVGATITQMGAAIGTPAYMAPEQVAGDPSTDHRADVYAWGVVAWELTVGQHPFASRTTAHALLAAQMGETPAFLATVRADTPPGLAALVARCLEKDPARRPQTAAELLAALDHIDTTSGVRGALRAPMAVSPRGIAAVAAGIAAVAVAVWFGFYRGGGEKSLAVLPFESVGGDTANVYFAEGIADELTTALTKVTGLRVAATSSAFSYRNTAADPREVGRALDVRTVLQGRVRREGIKMRVSAQLTDTRNGKLLWSGAYEREMKDVFAVQDELTRDIVGALSVTLVGGGAKPAKDTTDVETYDLYLRGLHFLQARGSGVARSIGYFQRALERDSMFARAWGELGIAYSVLPLFSPVPVDSVIGLARATIAKARALNSESAAAYTAEGLTNLLVLDWQGSARSLERAIAIDSTYTTAHRALTSALYQAGRAAQAIAQAQRATRLDPLSPPTHAVAAIMMLNSGRVADALAIARRANELDSIASFSHLIFALAMHASGHADSARQLLAGARAVPQSSPWLGYLLAATGDRAGATAFLNTLSAERGHNGFTNIAAAWTYLGGGDTTRALAALERAMRAREPVGFSVPFGMPAYDAVRHSPRFAAVVKGYGLDPANFGISEKR